MKRKNPVKVQIWVTEWRSQPMPRPSWKTQALTGTLLLGAVSMIVGGGWLAIQLMINPSALSWLGHLLPISTLSSREPQTLAEIQAEIRKAGNVPGPAKYLSQYSGLTQQQPGFQDMLLPIARPLKSCDTASSTHCQQIIELRVYRSTDRPTLRQGPTYELIDRLAIQGPEELAAIAALTDASGMTQGSTRTLPLTDLNWMTGKAPPGIWFQLSGEWKRGSRVLYGQVFRYEPDRRRLNLLQTWSSEAAQLPQWRQVTGNSTSELVVNRSIGLEPQFQVFQVKSSRSLVQPVTLEPISLTEAVLPDQSYDNALLLARHGLWSTALQLLKPLKQTLQSQGHWSAMAQAQMDLIALHTNVTKTQADRNWASPSQQILAQVMDDRWSKALSLLQSAHKSGYDVKNLLTSNADRLWKRVETALRVHPQQAELQQWGALMVAVQQNRNQALIWFSKQSQVAKKQQAIDSIQQTLALLDSPQHPDSDKQTPNLQETAATRTLAGLIGSVQLIDKPQPQEWLFLPTNAPTLSPQPNWYRVQVIRLQDQSDWQRTIGDLQKKLSSQPQQAQSLWQQLGLEGTALQIVIWKGATPFHTITVEIKAIQLHQGTLSLLTTGEALPPSIDPLTSIAITPNSISWSSVLSTQSLRDLAQQHPDWSQTLWPQLWQHLETAQLISPDFDRTDPLAALGDWSVQQMELTGDQSPEALLTLETRADDPKPHTLVFSAQGQILYSDLQTDRSLVTIADRADHPLPMLIISTAQGLKLQQWSAKNQRFE